MMGKFFCGLFALIFGRKKISDDYESYSLEEQTKSHTIHMVEVPEVSVDNETGAVTIHECSWPGPNTHVFPAKEND